MPLQNRVLPTGEIVSDPARGLLTGNRGILSFENGRLGTSRWAHQHWISCALTHPRGTYHGPHPARGWTPLFFPDEAVALAAGHRPCACCRRGAFDSFRLAWERGHGSAASAQEMDRLLHRTRVTRQRQQITHQADSATLPAGAFVSLDGAAWLVLPDSLRRFETGGYSERRVRPETTLTVLTPAPLLPVLAAGYRPLLHPSAHDLLCQEQGADVQDVPFGL